MFLRGLWAAFGILILITLAITLRQTGGLGWIPGCLFREMSGYQCPGCGMTRSTTAALNGDIREAVRLNVIGMIILPITMLWISLKVIAWVKGTEPQTSGKAQIWAAGCLGMILIAWGFIRNL